ncbi:MAG: PLDc N-terminal domain-containing protein, partial [Spirochaetales bacterium]|nr:PLDc N-terminal domain-containing protein [Spirochaetales bacterium]
MEYIIILAYYLYVLGATVYLILDNRDPAATLGWVLLITFVPVAGFIVYLFTGKNSRIHRKQLKAYQMPGEDFIRRNHPGYEEDHRLGMKSIEATDAAGAKSRLARILYSSAAAQISTNSSVEIIHKGDLKFSGLLRDIENASESIHLAYYIWSKDPVTEVIRKALFRKA